MDDVTLFDINAEIGESCHEPLDFTTPEALVAHLDYLGIDRTLVSLHGDVGNREILRRIEASGHRERLVPAFTLSTDAYYQTGT